MKSVYIGDNQDVEHRRQKFEESYARFQRNEAKRSVYGKAQRLLKAMHDLPTKEIVQKWSELKELKKTIDDDVNYATDLLHKARDYGMAMVDESIFQYQEQLRRGGLRPDERRNREELIGVLKDVKKKFPAIEEAHLHGLKLLQVEEAMEAIKTDIYARQIGKLMEPVEKWPHMVASLYHRHHGPPTQEQFELTTEDLAFLGRFMWKGQQLFEKGLRLYNSTDKEALDVSIKGEIPVLHVHD